MYTAMKQILNFYKSKYPYESFYELASVKIMKNKRLLGDNYHYLVVMGKFDKNKNQRRSAKANGLTTQCDKKIV